MTESPDQDNEDLSSLVADLKRRLKEEHEENAMLRRILFGRYARQPRVLNRLALPLPERAIILFEIMGDAFTLEDAVATAEQLGMTEAEAAEHVRTYFQEGMLVDEENGFGFAKTGFRPYLQG